MLEITHSPTEQTTAITDIVLALIAFGSLVYIGRFKKSDLAKINIWSWIFGLLAFSALLGTASHGFEMSSKVNFYLWQPLYLSLGFVIALFAVAAAYDIWGNTSARRLLSIMLAVAFVFYAITLLGSGSFLIFILYEGVTMVIALVAYIWLASVKQLKGALLMVAGILITIIAAVVQASKAISFTLIWDFDHNGAFHLLQSVGVIFLVAGIRASLLTVLDNAQK